MSSPLKKQQGFTLIELVVVIVILGVLSATALPKFIDLGSDAKIATLNGLAGTLKSAAQMTRAKLLVEGGSLTGHATITSQGQTYVMIHGYVRGIESNAILLASNVCISSTDCSTTPYNYKIMGDWDVWQIGGHVPTGATGRGVRIRLPGDTSESCYVQYEEAISGAPYSVTLETSDC
ncbi:MAG: prepilin-type N-terminal cleavage/methylation domain-containing protein [Colwellia sp.]|nr:prepilin-type N-terminal cleavage/methylation domain-containing protein [Colwellia sp.]